jgi:hypothetical protein
MTRFCPVSGNIHPSQKGFCSLCRIALLKKPTIINLDTILSPIPSLLIQPLLQDCAMHIPALPASRSVAGYAILAANAHAQRGNIPSAKQPALSTRTSRSATCISHRTIVSLFTIAYYFKSYKDKRQNIRTYRAINCESK